jgi:AraC-like DNA-binding protein
VGELFDTRRHVGRERETFWLETVCKQILPVGIDLRHDAVPMAAMATNRLGALRVRRVVGGDHVYTRTSVDVRRGDPETIQIGMPRVGSSILVQDGREAVLNAGDMVLYDSGRPFTLVMHERFNWQVFLLPKAKLRRSDAELRTLTAIPIDSSSGMAGIVHQFLSKLAADVDALEADPTADALGENAADLIATMVQSRFGMPWSVSDPDGVLREQICGFISRNHADVHLNPAGIAQAHGISIRRLHLVFEGTGTSVMDQLRSARLLAARRDLADPRMRKRSIGQIAQAHGMPNPTLFARQFRAEFAVTPRQFRSSVHAPQERA